MLVEEAMGQKTGNQGSNTEGICLQVNWATESGLTASLGPQVPRMPFRGLLMVQGANARPHEVSTCGLLTPFHPQSPVRATGDIPVGPTKPGPLCSLSHWPRGTFTAKPSWWHCLGCAPGYLSGQDPLAIDSVPLPRGRLSLVPALPESLTSWGSPPLGAHWGQPRDPDSGRDRETRLERPSPPLTLRNVLTGSRRLLVCAAVSWGGRQGRGAFWEAVRRGSSDVTPGAPFPVRKPGLLAWSERSALEKARLEAGRRSSQGRREARLAAATLSAAARGRWKAEG